MRYTFTPKLVNPALTCTLMCNIVDIEELENPVYQPMLARYNALLEQGWSFYIVAQLRGRCYYDAKVITIPVWAMQKTDSYWLYYLCHEIAHTLSKGDVHGSLFMQAFISICPEWLQHYEINYKPQAAMAAGIIPKDF